MKITVDPEFKSNIPPLSDEEYAQLEKNILADGCRDPLVLWGQLLVDGHNRYAICTKHGLPFNTVQKEFASRDEALDWTDANQLGRRNLTPDQRSIIRGRRYNRTKKANDGSRGNQHTVAVETAGGLGTGSVRGSWRPNSLDRCGAQLQTGSG